MTTDEKVSAIYEALRSWIPGFENRISAASELAEYKRTEAYVTREKLLAENQRLQKQVEELQRQIDFENGKVGFGDGGPGSPK